MIHASNIDINLGGTTIVKQISLELQAASVSVIIGKNGAGKSTLLKALAGELPIQSGYIKLDNTPLTAYSPGELADRRAVLSQSTQLAYALSVTEIIEMGCYNRYTRLTKKERNTLVEQTIEKLQLTAFSQRDFLSLSGGERQRVLLAKCLVQLYAGKTANKQQYLLLDEPTAALDIEQQYRFLQLATSLAREEGIGILAVLHDLNLAARFADRILLLRKGRLVNSGSPWDVLTTETLQQTFAVECLVQSHPHLNIPLITTYGNYCKPAKPLSIA